LDAKTLSPAAAVVPLAATGSDDPARIGGKAAGLARLLALGVEVPPGICVTVEAFADSVEHHGAEAELERLLAALGEPGQAERLTELARALPLSPAVAGAVAAGLARLDGARGFAVRSSGLDEDGARYSFAGQHTTVLGVDAADVPAAIGECWASTWSAGALAYRAQLGLDPPVVAIPVLVQPLLAAEASAIVFTANPVTGAPGEVVVNAVRGLGEPLARGAVTPDGYVVDKRNGAVLDAVGEPGARAHLGRAQLRALVEVCGRIEDGLGHAVDVEASLVDGSWIVLQARPLTTTAGG
jgi:phosphoenolpyruvate synthase/pyruvate phosphate dikinase